MKNILGFIFGLVVCLIFVEVYVSNSFVMLRYINDFDEEIGRIRKGNISYVIFKEGFGVGKINHLNYMNKEYPIDKNENTIRIAIIGDSFVESWGVLDRNYFGRIMETKLNEKLKQPVEVLNFGRSGFNTGDCYVYYNNFVKRFDPDIVIYILGEEDFTVENVDPLRPFVSLKNDSLSILKSDKYEKELVKFKKIQPLLNNSVLIANINSARKLINKKYIMSKIFDKLYIGYNKKEKKLHNKIPKIEITQELNLIFQALSKENGIFFLRSKVNLIGNTIDFYDITELFEDKGYNPNYWDISKTSGHWNNRAHQDIGEYMAKEIEKIIRSEQGLITNSTNNPE